jgi:alpha,alpha-trehalase
MGVLQNAHTENFLISSMIKRQTLYWLLGLGLILNACRPEVSTQSSSLKGPQDLYPGLFQAVQLAGIFPDSKTFVDYTPLTEPAQIEAQYLSLKDSAGFDLEEFVVGNFAPPQDFAIQFQTDTSLDVRQHIERLWPVLTRQPDSVQRGSLIPLPRPYIVPGGRFREVYYWDSYFTMLGLQQSETAQPMVRNMIENFAHLIRTVGFIPNGNRTYYLGRSQPPFFSSMVRLLAEMEGDAVLAEFVAPLEMEYLFWMDGLNNLPPSQPARNHLVRLKEGEVLNRYWDKFDTPRPESFREDVETAHASGRDSLAVYRDLRAGAASGWDYSSRWFADGQNIATIQTTLIIPPDLNALLYHLEVTLADAHAQAGHEVKKDLYLGKAESRKAALIKYCWNEEEGYFADYNWQGDSLTGISNLAMVYPLYFGMATQEQADAVARQIETQFLQPGGVVSTLLSTGQQWDAPNGWAPLQWMTIQGLRRYGHNELAQTIADRWVALNLKVFRNTGKLVEKYNVMDLELEAGGGEYDLQDGFGWTNGVLLRLLSE